MRQAIKLRPLSHRRRNEHRLPHDACDGDFSWLPTRVKHALHILYEADLYATALDCDIWQFAVALSSMQPLGINDVDIRFLVRAGIVDFAVEKTPHNESNRTFRRSSELVLGGSTCFVLTKSGRSIARFPENERQIGPMPRIERSTVSDDEENCLPKWDPDRQELRVGTVVVKRFKATAENQRAVLDAFEEEGWPARIDDPLPPRNDLAPKRRLHETIKSLNRHQKSALIRFVGDGRGQGVLWEFSDEIVTGD